jgi:hypothetical protein
LVRDGRKRVTEYRITIRAGRERLKQVFASVQAAQNRRGSPPLNQLPGNGSERREHDADAVWVVHKALQ